MAGRGFAPKDPEKRARRNAEVVQMKLVEAQAAVQPELPSFTVMVTIDDKLVTQEFEWSEMTRDWWRMLAHHPLAHEFFETDWAFLMETARIHEEFWAGKMALAGELRLREAKYGFTPEDRARLRIQVAQAAESEVSANEKVSKARDRARGVKPA